MADNKKGSGKAPNRDQSSDCGVEKRSESGRFQNNQKSGSVKEVRVVDTIHPPPPRDDGGKGKT